MSGAWASCERRARAARHRHTSGTWAEPKRSDSNFQSDREVRIAVPLFCISAACPARFAGLLAALDAASQEAQRPVASLLLSEPGEATAPLAVGEEMLHVMGVLPCLDSAYARRFLAVLLPTLRRTVLLHRPYAMRPLTDAGFAEMRASLLSHVRRRAVSGWRAAWTSLANPKPRCTPQSRGESFRNETREDVRYKTHCVWGKFDDFAPTSVNFGPRRSKSGKRSEWRQTALMGLDRQRRTFGSEFRRCCQSRPALARNGLSSNNVGCVALGRSASWLCAIVLADTSAELAFARR